MYSLTTKTIPEVSTGKNRTAPGDERRHNSTEDVVVDNNRASSNNAEMASIREETSEKKISENSICKKEKSVLDPNPNNDDQDENNDDLMYIRVPSGMILLEDGDESKRPTTIVPQKPAENLEVDNRAIVDCWNLTVASHDAATTIAPGMATGVSPSQPSTLNNEITLHSHCNFT